MEVDIEVAAHCQGDKNAPEGAREKNIVIKGSPEAVERAKQMISEKVGGGGGSYGGGHRGGYQQNYGQPEPAYHHAPSQVAPGQPDYSAQWAEYYRSLGRDKEAEPIEQQMRAKGGASAPAQYAAPQYGQPQ